MIISVASIYPRLGIREPSYQLDVDSRLNGKALQTYDPSYISSLSPWSRAVTAVAFQTHSHLPSQTTIADAAAEGAIQAIALGRHG